MNKKRDISLSKAQQRKAGIALAMINNGMSYFKGISIEVYNKSPLRYEINYIAYSNYDKGSAFGTGAEVHGQWVKDCPLTIINKGVSKGRHYTAQATLRKGEGVGTLVFPF